MICKKCGSELTSDMMFCGECGCPVENVAGGTRCQKCGTAAKADDIFCGECGYMMKTKDYNEIIHINSEEDTHEVNPMPVSEHKETVKSTLPSRKENYIDRDLYIEGKKFLQPAKDFT